jgi:hypothetical protein
MTNNKNIEKYKNMLLDLPSVNRVEHIESKTSNITTDWSATGFTPFQIAREFGANFYDSCIENKLPIDNVKISTKNDQIVMYSPKTRFSLKKLFFLGSKKLELDNSAIVGMHGEGYKLSIVSLARLSVYDPINISGSDALIVGIGKEDPETNLRPLVYHYFKINEQDGTYFIINTLSPELKKAFEKTMLNFMHPKNPLVGELLNEYNDIQCYKSTEKDGYGFYRGLQRIKIKNIPVIINIKKPYAALEKLTRQDRDRNNFSEKIQGKFFNIFCSSGFGYEFNGDNPAIYHIIKSSKPIWEKGAPLLRALASASYSKLKDSTKLKKLFGNNYFAESKFRYCDGMDWSTWYSTTTQSWILRRDRRENQKKKKLPSYFSYLGLESSLDAFIRSKKNSEKRIKNKKTADLTSKENRVVDFLFKASRAINPSFANLFNINDEESNLYDVKFRKIFCKELHGELKNNSSYNSKTVYLHKDLFKANFGTVFSVFLHELSHATGSKDGQREFSDMLTVLLGNSIDKHKTISKYNKEWNRYRV